jgi:hypothetical protein
MAAMRCVSRLLTRRTLNTMTTRGYADEMQFTFAAGNQVLPVKINHLTNKIMM